MDNATIMYHNFAYMYRNNPLFDYFKLPAFPANAPMWLWEMYVEICNSEQKKEE